MGDDTFRANFTRRDGRSVVDSVEKLDDKYKELGKQVIDKFCMKAKELRSQPQWNECDLALIIDRINVGRKKERKKERICNQFLIGSFTLSFRISYYSFTL